MANTNNCQGTVHTTRCEHSAGPPLKKRDCEEVKSRVREAEKSMSWFQYIATQNDSWRNPWVIFAKFNECKRLPPEIDSGAYTQLRDKLRAYDRGEIAMSGEDAMELRRTVKLVQDRYDNVPTPYVTAPADYISPAEQEVYDRFGNNMTMALVPATIPGIAGTRLAGGTEAQARAGGELSAQMFGFMGFRFMQKHGLLRNNPQPVQNTRNGSPTVSSPGKMPEPAEPPRAKVGIAVAAKPLPKPVVTATSTVNGREFKGTNQSARENPDPNKRTAIADEIESGKKFKEGNPNTNMSNAHAEIEVMQKAHDAGIANGSNMTIQLTGQDMCGFCRSNVAAMADKIGLNNLTVIGPNGEMSTWVKGSGWTAKSWKQ
jgi:hypothetical protein